MTFPPPSHESAHPLSVREALEEEFVQLHGQLPAQYAKASAVLAAATDRSDECWVKQDRQLLGRLYQHVHGLDRADPPAAAASAVGGAVSRDPTDDERRAPRSALCLSGGGIRSATFGLGVLQALAARGLLEQFDFLSTVSGGGYVGSWLSAWIHRHPDGASGVAGELKIGADGGPSLAEAERAGCAAAAAAGVNPAMPGEPAPPADPDEPAVPVEAGPVNHLRQYSNYLTPRLGAFSGDAWTVAATYLRNLVLNWIVLIPFLVGVLLLPHVFLRLLELKRPPGSWPSNVVVGLTFLWFIGLVTAVTWLPSLQKSVAAATRVRPRGAAAPPDPSAAADPPRPRHPDRWEIVVWTVVPTLISCGLTVVTIAWHAPGSTPWPWPWRLGVGVASYLLAAAAVQIATLVRRLPNPPRASRLYPAFLALALTTFLMMGGLLTTDLFKSPLGNPSGPHPDGVIPYEPRLFACVCCPILLGVYVLTLSLYVGLTSWDSHPYADEDREWWARLMGMFLLAIAVWLVTTGVALFGPALVKWASDGKHLPWASVMAVLAGGVGLLGGRQETVGPHEVSLPDRFRDRLARRLPALCAQAFLLMFLLVLSWGVNGLVQAFVDCEGVKQLPGGWRVDQSWLVRVLRVRFDPATHAPLAAFWRVVWLTAGMFAAVALLGRLINVNRLSLHAMYRNRLIRAYLGASNPDRRPNPFTGFDPSDNIPMHHLRRRAAFCAGDVVGHDPERGPDHEGVIRLVRLFRRDTNFGRYAWQMLPTPEPEYLLAELDRIKAAERHRETVAAAPGAAPARRPPGEGKNLVEPVVRHLNRLVRDPALWEHSRYRDPDQRARDPEVDAAFRNRENDGSADLLNRLILERECVWDEPGNAADAPAPAAGAPAARAQPLLGGARPPKPFHVINGALNLVHGQTLAWQQRKATSFTITPLHTGFARGYRPSVEYASGITLGTAVTISGAAASPNMGYHSSPAVTFLMTLFNVRLGWWLGNPADATKATPLRELIRWLADGPWRRPREGGRAPFRLQSPRHPLRPVFDEAFGRTDEDNDYVYLSDGGHFENLGLYEMVRRRCRHIFVCDASCDPKRSLTDLGNALRKIRIDLGVPIKVRNAFFPRKGRFNGQSCAIGTIEYAAVDRAVDGSPGVRNGVLIYLKPAMPRAEPVDVFNYAAGSDTFPHETTADQWFTESQFESYRKLGETLAGDLIDGAGARRDLPAFFAALDPAAALDAGHGRAIAPGPAVEVGQTGVSDPAPAGEPGVPAVAPPGATTSPRTDSQMSAPPGAAGPTWPAERPTEKSVIPDERSPSGGGAGAAKSSPTRRSPRVIKPK